MTILKFFLFIAVAFGVFTLYAKYRQTHPSAEKSATVNLSPAGFFLINTNDAQNQRVLVAAPPNCPSAEAARARALVTSLNASGIPAEITSGFSISASSLAESNRINGLVKAAPGPIVLVRGWAKGNPSVQDVIAQYREK
ncbi:hypothetical protein [Oleiharenicola lentus]|uniref:hypothetical protein n=1 Tax=Oleiharenicola lentus TaxID=2508720 RepID=UPI003F66C015